MFSMVVLLSVLAACVQAIPSRGHYPFAVALCKASDKPAEPITVAKVQQFFTSAGSSTPGMYNFFREQSSNAIDFEGSVIGGWYTIPHTYAEIATYNRQQRLQVCLDAATAAGFKIPSTHKHMALYNTASDMGEVGGGGGGVVLQADYHFGISLAGHEVMHTLGEPHSRTASQTAPPVEYGDSFDLMSTEDVYTSYDDGVYSTSGPNLCAPARDRMGWIAMDRIYTPPNNANKVLLKLTPLSLNPSTTTGYLMGRIPIYTKAGQPFAYYTVELRTATGFDRGIPNLGDGNSGIVIHRVNETDQANWLFLARYAQGSKPYSWSYQAGDQFLDLQGGVEINVISIASDLSSAQLQITASGNPPHIFYGPNTCKNGLVWREGDKLDYTCVTPERRTKVASDNQLCASRILSNGYCKQGWVWREAWPGDHCCVEPAERSTAQGETKNAYTGVASDYTSLSNFASAPLSPVIP